MSVLDGEEITIRGRRYPIVTCGSCPARVVWVVTAAKSKPMPMNPNAVENGNLVVVDVGDRGPVMRVLKKGEDPGLALRYVSHFVTCPNGPAHRRKS